MSEADKRSVTTDALTTLGTIIDPSQKRDAIHLAVEPVIAGMYLRPGDHLTVKDGVGLWAPMGQGLGIVDPFLTIPIEKGQWFWFVMYPRQVRSLRHVWSHPAFPDECEIAHQGMPNVAAAEAAVKAREHEAFPQPPTINPAFSAAVKRLHEIAAELPVTYEELMAAAIEWLRDGEYKTQYGAENWRDNFYQYEQEFWRLYDVVTGVSAPNDKRGNFFSCSC